MKFTQYTDYSFRALIYLGQVKKGELTTVKRISEHYQVSYNHLVKVIQELRKNGYVLSVRGRTGGIMLAKPPKKINLYDVMNLMQGPHRYTKKDKENQADRLVNEFCVKPVLDEARKAFDDVLRGYNLEDLCNLMKKAKCL